MRQRWSRLAVLCTATALIAGGTAPGAAAATVENPSPRSQAFWPSSTSWTSPSNGWVLGWEPCDGDQRCAALQHTSDGGQSWHEREAPAIPHPSPGGRARLFVTSYEGHTVGAITDGSYLYTSFNDLTTWHRQPLARVSRFGAVGATAHSLYVVVYAAGRSGTSMHLLRTPLAEPRWHKVPGVTVDSNGSSTLSTARRMVQVGSSTPYGTSHLWTDAWRWTGALGKRMRIGSPCTRSRMVMSTDLTPDGRTYVLCSFNPGLGHMHKTIKVSPDGVHFALAGKAPDLGTTSDFAVADSSTIAIGAGVGGAGLVYMSFDGGATWTTALATPGSPRVHDLDFQDPLHGTLVTGSAAAEDSAVFRTTDGGHTWTPLRIPRG